MRMYVFIYVLPANAHMYLFMYSGMENHFGLHLTFTLSINYLALSAGAIWCQRFTKRK